MKKNHKKQYDINQSPFYGLHNKKRLSKILFTSPKKLSKLTNSNGLYYEFEKTKKGTTKKRPISAPRDDLKKVQLRIAELLRRLQPPEYLFSPVKGRSYVDNARRHIGSSSIHLLDIENFYPKCKESKVYWFFNKKMKCSSDVSRILCKIVCYQGSLPQGSPCSPFLAYFAYMDMWNEVNAIATACGCKISLYVDDLTVSGSSVPGEMIWSLKKILKAHDHTINRKKEKCVLKRPVEITGAILHSKKLSPPDRQLQKLYEAKKALSEINQNSELGTKLAAQIKGRQVQISQITV